jgi:hypothetical protein
MEKNSDSFCLLQTKMETANFRLFAENEFVFLGRKNINGIQRCFSKRAHL